MAAPKISTPRKLTSGRARRIAGSVKRKSTIRSRASHTIKNIFSHSYRYNASGYLR